MNHSMKLLCDRMGVTTEYVDGLGQARTVPEDSLLSVLRALGAPIDRASDAEAVLADVKPDAIPPVVLAAPGQSIMVDLTDPALERRRLRLIYEDGTERTLDPILETRSSLGQLSLPPLPIGVYELRLEGGPLELKTTILVSPDRVPTQQARGLGVFAPTYALFDRSEPRRGGYACLGSLVDWAGRHGATMVSTLPLLAAFLDQRASQPFEPSPYAPASRLALNELYTELSAAPEYRDSEAARAIYESTEFQEAMAREADADLVDYASLHALRRPALLALAAVFDRRADRDARLAAVGSIVQHYAEFRAAGDPQSLRYHRYAQVLAHEQLEALRDQATARGVELYLDCPIGVHGESFDVATWRDCFASGVSVGAPPDALFINGQNWAFPPLHPERSREGGHAYYRACLSHQMRYAHVLRIDHVMGLHRQFWIPDGAAATEGTYVRYPAQELYAALTLASQRSGCRVIGENLGTVPPEVGPELSRRGIAGMYVLPFEIGDHLRSPGAEVVACLNTHDMPTFDGFLRGLDIVDHYELGLIDEDQKHEKQIERAKLVRALLESLHHLGYETTSAADSLLAASLRFLAESSAQDVLVNIEDLWLSDLPQNVPGTYRERPNFRRRLRFGVDELATWGTLIAELSERRSGSPRGLSGGVVLPAD